MSKIRIGIIGTGFTIGIAMSHIRGYGQCAETEVVACYDKVRGRAEKFLEKNNLTGIKVCESLQELFDCVDAVSLCVPNSEHAPLAVAAIEAGKHVLIEKPFSTSVEAGQAVLEASRKHPEIVAMTCFNYHEQAPIQYMKEIIDSGVLGDILTVRHNGGGPRMIEKENVYLEWRMRKETSGTGSLADFGAHMLDLTDWMMGDQIGKMNTFTALTTTAVKERYPINPESVMGEKGSDKKEPVTNDDAAAFVALTDRGVLCSFMTGRINLAGAEYEISGSNGAISNSNKWPKGTIGMMLKDRPVPGQTEKKFGMVPVEIPEKYCGIGTDGVQHYGVICEFADCIKNHKKPLRDVERGLYIQSLIDAFARSAEEKRTITL